MNKEQKTINNSSLEGIKPYIMDIDNFLKLSIADNDNQQGYLNQIVENVRIIKDMALVYGYDGIEKLAFNIESKLKNILQNNCPVTDIIKIEIEYNLAAIEQVVDLNDSIDVDQLVKAVTADVNYEAHIIVDTAKSDFDDSNNNIIPHQSNGVDSHTIEETNINKSLVLKKNKFNLLFNKKSNKENLVIGLDISASSIKIVVLKKKNW